MPLERVRLSRILLAILVVAILAGCAASGSPGRATQWVVEDAQQKARLNAEGFPQYVGAS